MPSPTQTPTAVPTSKQATPTTTTAPESSPASSAPAQAGQVTNKDTYDDLFNRGPQSADEGDDFGAGASSGSGVRYGMVPAAAALAEGGEPAPARRVDSGSADAPVVDAPGAEPTEGEPEEVSDEADREAELLKYLVPPEEKPAAQPATPAAQTPAAPVKVARDYNGFSADEAKMLKRMDNQAFNHFSKMLREQKEVASRGATQPAAPATPAQPASSSVLDHEEGYTLTPEYKAATKFVEGAIAIEQHWQQQFALARQGKSWTDLVDDGRGGLKLVPGQESSAEAEAELLSHINFASQQRAEATRSVNQVSRQFQQNRAQQVATMQNVVRHYFPMYEQPRDSTKQLMDKVGTDLQKIGILPSNPAYELLRRSATLNFETRQLLNSRQKQQATQAKQVAAGPTTTHTAGSTTRGAGVPDIKQAFANLLASDGHDD